MAALIPKTNSTTGSATAPLASSLATGELSSNKFTSRLYLKNEAGNAVDTARTQLTGDVTGTTAAPTSATDGGTIAATVGKIQGRAVASTAPVNGETLAWNAGTAQYEPKTLQVQAAKTAAYPLVLTDANTLIPFSLSSPASCTIPLNATQAFPIGTQILIQQVGTTANQVTIAVTAGVTLQSSKTKTNAQWSIVTLIKTATDSWALAGDAA